MTMCLDTTRHDRTVNRAMRSLPTLHCEGNVRKLSAERILIGCFAATLVCPAAIAAQDDRAAAANAAQEALGLEEMIVTARKRAESIQDVPVSIRALSDAELQRLGADSLQDFTGSTPGLQLTGDATQTQIVMRGVTTGPVNHDQTEIKETVGLYLDEVPISVQRFSPNLKLFDLERVEVLRGPQGTLYGAGSMAGAVRMITRKPQAETVEAELSGAVNSVSHGDQGLTLDAMLNVPLVDDVFAVRAVGFYRDNPGYIDNIIVGASNANRESTKGGRIATRYQPHDALSIDTLLFYQDTEYEASFNYAAEYGYLNHTKEVLEPSLDDTLVASVTMTYDLEIGTLTTIGSHLRKELNYFSENGTYTNFATGFRDGLGGVYDNKSEQSDYSGEVRLSSRPGSRVEWTVGAFYNYRENFYSQDFTVPGVDAAGGFDSTDYSAAPDQIFFSDINVEETQLAFYGEAVVPLGQQWRATFGGRWFTSKQDSSIFFAGILADPAIGLYTFENEEDGFNPRVNLSYQIDDDRLIYVQAARGFRLGGTNEPVPLPVCQADLDSRGLSTAPQAYDSDHLWNYELGAKTEWLDRRMTINTAIYKIEWRNPQVTAQLGCGFNVFVNAGGLDIYGAELDAAIRPANGLTLRAGVGHTSSELTDDLAFVDGVAGMSAPYTPEWTYSLSGDYQWPLTNEFDAFIFVHYQHTGSRKTRFNLASRNAYLLDGYGALNGRIGVTRDRWSVELFGDNLTNERGEVNRSFTRFALTPITQVLVIQPRTVGIRAGVRF